MFPGALVIQSAVSEESCQGKQKDFSAGVLLGALSLIELPAHLHEHFKFDERDFDLSVALEHYSSLGMS